MDWSDVFVDVTPNTNPIPVRNQLPRATNGPGAAAVTIRPTARSDIPNLAVRSRSIRLPIQPTTSEPTAEPVPNTPTWSPTNASPRPKRSA